MKRSIGWDRATLVTVSLFFCLSMMRAQASPGGGTHAGQKQASMGQPHGNEIKRPKILGLAHVAYYVSGMQQALGFYERLLGYDAFIWMPNAADAEQPNTSSNSDPGKGDAWRGTVILQIGGDQYLELSSVAPAGDGQLSHIAFQTDDARAMRSYLASHGIQVPQSVGVDRNNNLNFTISDPDGHRIEFLQYDPAWISAHRGQHVHASRVSGDLRHTGFTVGSVSAAMKFYADTLGFREFWRGSSNGTELSWVNMRVPDGDDYVEFMLYRALPPPAARGSQNHICLVVPDMQKAIDELKKRAPAAGYTKPIEERIGRNRKRQANLYDPDGTRVELMEANTIDGQPAPSSNAPAPRR